MNASELAGVLGFLRGAERLKLVSRSSFTSEGDPESVADHSWRLCLMALVLRHRFPEVDFGRVLEICVVHDLGEAIGGDVPAPEQARRLAAGSPGKAEAERRDLLTLLEPLPEVPRRELLALWDEYEAGETTEAQMAKALDKLETILQHNQGKNPEGFDYRFNLAYGERFTASPPDVRAIRQELDRETSALADAAEAPPR
jgi:putative hydrolases of HD superfamily